MSDSSLRPETVKVYGLDHEMRRQIAALAAYLMEADSTLPLEFRHRAVPMGSAHDELCTTVASLLRGVLAAPPDVLDQIITLGVFANLPPAERHNLVRPVVHPDRLPPAHRRGEAV